MQQQFQELRQKALAWYSQQTDNDRKIIVGLGCLLVIVILIFAIWLPAEQAREGAIKKYAAQFKNLQEMQSLKPLAKGVAGSSKTSVRGSLLSLVNSSANSAGVSIKRSQPEGDDQIRLWLEKVPFNQTIDWVNTLTVEYGLSIGSATIEPRKTSGTVDMKLTLKR